MIDKHKVTQCRLKYAEKGLKWSDQSATGNSKYIGTEYMRKCHEEEHAKSNKNLPHTPDIMPVKDSSSAIVVFNAASKLHQLPMKESVQPMLNLQEYPFRF